MDILFATIIGFVIVLIALIFLIDFLKRRKEDSEFGKELSEEQRKANLRLNLLSNFLSENKNE